jgi:hypothetical protein
MSMDELDRILREDEIPPSPAFVGRVMTAVRREAAEPPPIPLPWRRLVVAPALSLVLVVVAAFQSPAEVQTILSRTATEISWCVDQLGRASSALKPVGLGLWTLLGSLLVAFLLWPLAVPAPRLRRLP